MGLVECLKVKAQSSSPSTAKKKKKKEARTNQFQLWEHLIGLIPVKEGRGILIENSNKITCNYFLPSHTLSQKKEKLPKGGRRLCRQKFQAEGCILVS
jgi:hypothetical protein